MMLFMGFSPLPLLNLTLPSFIVVIFDQKSLGSKRYSECNLRGLLKSDTRSKRQCKSTQPKEAAKHCPQESQKQDRTRQQ